MYNRLSFYLTMNKESNIYISYINSGFSTNHSLTLTLLGNMTSVDSVASDRPAHPLSLIEDPHCPLICKMVLH